MMVEAAPAAALIVTEADLLLEFEVVAFDPPAQLGLIDHAFEWDVGRQRGEPVMIRFGLTLRPFDQQPLFGRRFAAFGVVARRTHPPTGEPRDKRLLPSRHLICCQASAASSRANVLAETG